MKHEWRKHEKELYGVKEKVEQKYIGKQKFIMIDGKGNPNEEIFSKKIETLYGLSYGIKMLPKNGVTPEGYYDYTVYPLEGIWTTSDPSDVFNKDKYEYTIMVRQPEFVTQELFDQVMEKVRKKKPNLLFDEAYFGEIEDGECVQILHIGSYDDEPRSFALMKEYINEHGLKRERFDHREIYLSQPGKVDVSKMKTILRYFVVK